MHWPSNCTDSRSSRPTPASGSATKPWPGGREVNTYDHSWRVVRAADHPALGLCLDSFHILSRGSDPAGIADIPGEKLFFLQLADAPYADMNVLQWSRHYRLFPGQGAFDLPAFLGHVLAAGYAGPLSLEVFNDVFRQSDPRRTAVDAHRSLLALQEATTGLLPSSSATATSMATAPSPPELHGLAFVELVVDADAAAQITGALTGLGFRIAGTHRRKPVTLWAQGSSRVLVNVAQAERADTAAVAALGIDTASPGDATARAQALQAPVLPRSRGPAEADIHAVGAPDGVEVFFCRTDDPAGWRADFPDDPAAEAPGTGISHTDHVALTQPFDRFDEATLFYRSILGLAPQHSSEIAAPFGLVRNRAMADADRTVRICLSVSVLRRGADWHPGVTDPQHVAFATPDILALARARAGRRGARAGNPGQLLRRSGRPAGRETRTAARDAGTGCDAGPGRPRRIPTLLHRGFRWAHFFSRSCNVWATTRGTESRMGPFGWRRTAVSGLPPDKIGMSLRCPSMTRG